MSVDWGSSSLLHPNYLLGLVLPRLQGAFVGQYFFPDKAVENPEYSWFYYGTVGGMTPEVAENDPGRFTQTMYEKRVGLVKFYRERGRISNYAKTPYIIRDRAQDEMANLAERARLRQESLRINAIINNAITSVAAKTYFWKDADDDGSNWEGGSGNVSPIDDIIDAQRKISQYGKALTDTIVGSPQAIAALKKNLEVRDWQRSGPVSQKIIIDGQLVESTIPGSHGRLVGHEVFESNASILSDPNDDMSPLQMLLGNDLYIFKRGSELGAMHMFEGIKVLTKVEEFSRETQVQLGFACEPNLYRPQWIFTIKNVI